AIISGANFAGVTKNGFVLYQLYSTANYKAHDLSGVVFDDNDLTGANLAGQKLTKATFSRATLAAANFTGVDLSGITFQQATLTGANFTSANLTGVTFIDSWLAGSDFTDATILRADISSSDGFTAAQLVSTASYKMRNLAGIILPNMDLTSIDLSLQNL